LVGRLTRRRADRVARCRALESELLVPGYRTRGQAVSADPEPFGRGRRRIGSPVRSARSVRTAVCLEPAQLDHTRLMPSFGLRRPRHSAWTVHCPGPSTVLVRAQSWTEHSPGPSTVLDRAQSSTEHSPGPSTVRGNARRRDGVVTRLLPNSCPRRWCRRSRVLGAVLGSSVAGSPLRGALGVSRFGSVAPDQRGGC